MRSPGASKLLLPPKGLAKGGGVDLVAPTQGRRRWLPYLSYSLLVIIAFFPLITERPYAPQDTQLVIFEIISRTTQPYANWGWIFHLGTLLVIVLTAWKPEVGSRAIAAYFGLNYLVIAAVQTHAQTPAYGYAIHTGALIADSLLGLLWLGVAWKNRLHLNFTQIPRWRWALLPLALLTFWSPLTLEGTKAVPNFTPLLLLTSPDYGLAYCFLTPVFLFLLILAWPRVDRLALQITAFNGLLYGLFNLSHWSTPERLWLGVMHLPLLILSAVALGLTHAPSRPQP